MWFIEEELTSKGHKFVSQTDTEVIVHFYNDTKKAFQNTIARLEGAFINHKKVFFFKHGSPLIVAKEEVLASSVVYLEDGVGGIASAEEIDNYSWSSLPTSKRWV